MLKLMGYQRLALGREGTSWSSLQITPIYMRPICTPQSIRLHITWKLNLKN